MLQWLFGDRDSVYASAIAAVQIFDTNLGGGADQEAVLAGKRAVDDTDLIVRSAANGHFSFRQRESLALEWT